MREMTEPLPLARWTELGVRTTTGTRLPAADRIASLVTAGSRSFLVYGNYEALLAYNCAHAYALSVGLLAEALERWPAMGGRRAGRRRWAVGGLGGGRWACAAGVIRRQRRGRRSP